MEELIRDINLMIKTVNTDIEFNDVVKEINKDRHLGSGNQCYRVMYKVTQYLNVKKVLEIGTHKGASAITFCQAVLDNNLIPEIHTVDNWSQEDNGKISEDNILKAKFSKYITNYVGDSIVVVPEIFKKIGKVNLVFIDGNHDEEYIIKDYNNCKEYCDKILFHDTLDGNKEYLTLVKNDGYTIYNFETKYLEGNEHLIGIALAIKNN